MKTLAEVLRDADPQGYEPQRSPQERRLSRATILAEPRAAAWPRRSFAVAAAGMLVLAAAGTGSRYWPRAVVDVVAAIRFEIYLAEESPAAGLLEVAMAGTGRRLYVHGDPVVANSDIAEAHVIQGATASTFSVSLTFNEEGAREMRRATESHLGRPLAVFLDGELVTAPMVRGTVTAVAVIDGYYTRDEAERIVAGIVGR